MTASLARQIVLAARPQGKPQFLRDVGARIADGRIRYREDIVDGLDKAPEASLACWTGAISASWSCALARTDM